MEESYIRKLEWELELWQREILKPAGFLERNSKRVQVKINNVIPQRIHNGITATIKGMFNTVLFGLDFIPKSPPRQNLKLEERDELAKELLSRYQKIAAAEGAGTGAGGIIAGLADFPALIAIKLKFLFELAHLYGYSTKEYSERLFLLFVFQLAFSSQNKRAEILETILHWDDPLKSSALGKESVAENDSPQVDWEELQKEYRDAIDFRKMLQLMPGIGAVVGAWANHGLMEDLGRVGINCFRLRILGRMKKGETNA